MEDAGIKEGDKIQVKLLEIDQKTVSSASRTRCSPKSPRVTKNAPHVVPVVRMANVRPRPRTLNPTRVACRKVSTPAEPYPLLERFKQRVCADSMNGAFPAHGALIHCRQGGKSAAQTIKKGRNLQGATAGGAKQGAGGKSLVCSPYRH